MRELWYLSNDELIQEAIEASKENDYANNPPSRYINEWNRRLEIEHAKKCREYRIHVNKRRINQVREEHKEAMKVYRDIIKQINDLRAEYLELTR